MSAIRQRRYSISEIDEMRQSVAQMLWRGPKDAIEDQLRTHMLNGTDPSDLRVAGELAAEEMAEHQRVCREQGQALRNAMRQV